MKITQLVLDGVADGSVGIGHDIIGAAARAVRAGLVDVAPSQVPASVRILSVDGQAVRTSAGRSLSVDGALVWRNLGPDDTIVVPGLGLASEEEIVAGLSRSDVARACELVVRALDRGANVAASCSASFVLGAAGVLDGREATTTWWLGPSFRARFPRVMLRTDRMVVRSGRVFTAGSAFGHADLMLAILSAGAGPQLAHLVAQYLVLDERTSQARYMVTDHVHSSDTVVRALERFIVGNIERQLSVQQMARATKTSPRTLARKLAAALQLTPLAFARRLRIAQAMHLLETTRDSVDEIAARVGYADAAAFRRIFRRETGQAPRERRRAGARAGRG